MEQEEEKFITSGPCNEGLGCHRLVGFADGAESGAATASKGAALLLLTCLFSSKIIRCQQAASTRLADQLRCRLSYR